MAFIQTPNRAIKVKAWVGFMAISIGMFMAILDIQIVASSLPEIQAGLGIALNQLSWVQTVCLIAEIVAIPLTGWLTCVLSTRGAFLACICGFTGASLACAANSFASSSCGQAMICERSSNAVNQGDRSLHTQAMANLTCSTLFTRVIWAPCFMVSWHPFPRRVLQTDIFGRGLGLAECRLLDRRQYRHFICDGLSPLGHAVSREAAYPDERTGGRHRPHFTGDRIAR